MDDQDEPYGHEWQAKMMKFNKAALIEMLANAQRKAQLLHVMAGYRDQGRHYLMSTHTEALSVEHALDALGYTANGFEKMDVEI